MNNTLSVRESEAPWATNVLTTSRRPNREAKWRADRPICDNKKREWKNNYLIHKNKPIQHLHLFSISILQYCCLQTTTSADLILMCMYVHVCTYVTLGTWGYNTMLILVSVVSQYTKRWTLYMYVHVFTRYMAYLQCWEIQVLIPTRFSKTTEEHLTGSATDMIIVDELVPMDRQWWSAKIAKTAK